MESKRKLPALDHIRVPEDIGRAWQESVDLIANLFNAPAVLIRRFHEMEDLKLFMRNQHARHADDRKWSYLRPYCEHVMNTNRPLYVPDARKDSLWSRYSSIDKGLISYLGIPITWPKGEVFGTLCILDSKATDYSEHHRRLLWKFGNLFMADLKNIWYAIELEKAKEANRKLKKEMSLFLGIAAHDLKGSLNVMLGCCNMFLDKVEAKTNKERTYLDLIHRSSVTMQNLLAELMDISRIESMRLPVSMNEADLNQVVKDAVQYHQPMAEAKVIQINLLIPSEPTITSIDPVKIDQALSNLMSNAIKFSQRYSTITVTIDKKPEEIVVSVQDQGPGIPMDEQYNLFRPFQITSIEPPPGETSTGLGLYIARRIIEEHGGRIWVESEPGVGSMFCFSLKRTQPVIKKSDDARRLSQSKHMGKSLGQH